MNWLKNNLKKVKNLKSNHNNQRQISTACNKWKQLETDKTDKTIGAYENNVKICTDYQKKLTTRTTHPEQPDIRNEFQKLNAIWWKKQSKKT